MTLTTPLEDETLLLNKVWAREEISELFQIRAEVYSPNSEINFDQIVGQKVSLQVELPAGGGRFFNGVVSSFSQGDTVGTVTAYTLDISPWFWFLSQTQRCRIFPTQDTPEMTIKDILQSVFKRWVTSKVVQSSMESIRLSAMVLTSHHSRQLATRPKLESDCFGQTVKETEGPSSRNIYGQRLSRSFVLPKTGFETASTVTV